MNKQFIITNFAAFALMLFLPTGCRQAAGCGAELSGHKGRGKSGGNLRVLFRRHTRTAGCGHPAANIRAHYPSESERG